MDLPFESQTDATPGRTLRLWGWLRHRWRRRTGSEPERPRRLLFLDDDPRRAEVFLEQNPEAVWVTTVGQCLDRLRQPWDEIHLDHDLGGKTFVDSQDEDCGMEVIRWLCKEPRPHLKDARFFVHTHHAAAGLLMVLHMRGCGYKAEFRPFGLDLARLLAHNEPRADGEPGTLPAVDSGPARPAAAGQDDQNDSEIQPPPRTKSSS